MQVYLPIAEVSVSIFLLIGLGGIVGILSGLFGVGGGFLMTPLLFFIGIPPAIAVATEANQIVASSFSGALAHLRRKTVDLKMGWILVSGGLIALLILLMVKKAKERFFVIDLIVADISLVVTKRSEFNSMLKTVDYNLEEFNNKLRSQNNSSYQKLIN